MCVLALHGIKSAEIRPASLWHGELSDKSQRAPLQTWWIEILARGLYNSGCGVRRRVTEMALVIEGEEHIAASIQKVWEALNDPDTLKACIPGCETPGEEVRHRLAAIVILKIGPIKATLRRRGDAEKPQPAALLYD